jgi:sucrose-6-phosphate hydrolase SacC (GH32 family)
MWYLSGREWLAVDGRMEPVYRIAHATSSDGMQWARNGTPIIPGHTEHECQDILAPYHHAGKWHALFAFRDPAVANGAYRLGYATSDDLESWIRDDTRVGLTPSESGWDSAMLCYPRPFEVDGRLLLFYCGNAFGREGFGVAELDGD